MQSDIVERLNELIDRALYDNRSLEMELAHSDDCHAEYRAEREMTEATRDAVIAEITALRDRVARLEGERQWRVGTAQGSVVGELKKVDDLEAENEFVLVPPVGAKRIVCVFPESLRDRMGENLFRVVRVTGYLHYGEESPFPLKVDANSIEPMPKRRKSLADLRGMFAGKEQVPSEWDVWPRAR